jgi:hypothetical protein
MIPVAQFLGAYPLFRSLILGSGAVFIGTAYIEGVIAPKPAEPGKGIGG